eukprot:1469244-Prymnesium_polylepis.2
MQPHARHHMKYAGAVLSVNCGSLFVRENFNVESRMKIDLSTFESENYARRQVDCSTDPTVREPLGPGLRGGRGGKLGGEGGGGGETFTRQPGTGTPAPAHEARQSEPSRVSSAAPSYVNRKGHPAAITSWRKEARFLWHAPRNPPDMSLAMSSSSSMSEHSNWSTHSLREPNTFGASTQSGWDPDSCQLSKVRVRYVLRVKLNLAAADYHVARRHMHIIDIEMQDRTWLRVQAERSRLNWRIAPPMSVNAPGAIHVAQEAAHCAPPSDA